MPKGKLTFEDFKQEKEYIMWERIYNMLEQINLTQSSFESSSCDGVYWEPLLVLIYKFGNYIKVTGKLKEIKMDYIRPITYLGNQSNENVTVDGDHWIVDKTGISNAVQVRFQFSAFLAAVSDFPNLDDKTFQKSYKTLQTATGRLFKSLNAFVKEGWRYIHENVKEILKPFRMLRKSAYRIVSIEKYENNNEDLTMFSNKKSMNEFVEKVGTFFAQEEFKTKRDAEVGKLMEVLGPTLEEDFYKYQFNDKAREDGEEEDKKEEEKKTETKSRDKRKKTETPASTEETLEPEIKKKHLINIEQIKQNPPSRFQKIALHKDFEDGFDESIKLLNRKLPQQFPFRMEAHKMFVNFQMIPNGRKIKQIEYFLGDFEKFLEELKIYLYELKLNGLARLQIPISKNEELIEKIKKVYDIHLIIDHLLGDKLLYDQYLFFYSNIEMITNSSLKEHLEVLKDKSLIERNIPRYIVYEALVHGAKVLKKMIDFARLDGGHYDINNFFQPTKHKLNTEDNLVVNCYEEDSVIMSLANEEVKKWRKTIYNEIDKFGRFWMLEGYFPTEDKDKWLEAIKILVEINILVQEDIRDMILLGKEEEMKRAKTGNTGEGENKEERKQTVKDSRNTDSSKKLERMDSKISKMSKETGRGKGRRNSRPRKNSSSKLKGPSRIGKRRNSERSLYGEDEVALPSTLEGLRPPIVWNFPIERIVEMKNEAYAKRKKEAPKKEIRIVNPFLCYSDGRIEKFMEFFEEIAEHFFAYCKEKGNIWEYAYIKILKVLKIEYEYKRPKPKKKEEEGSGEDEKEAEGGGDETRREGDESELGGGESEGEPKEGEGIAQTTEAQE